MEKYQALWNSALELLRQKLNNDHVFDVWFGDITAESYDEERRALLLQVTSPYVYEYLEQLCTRLMNWALTETFGPGVQLSYRVKSEPAFAQAVDYLKKQYYRPGQLIPQITVTNAEKRLRDGLHYFLKGKEQWLPAYDKVAAWLSDNRGRGLLCVGTTGLGKSLICQQILPVILGCTPVSVPAIELRRRIDSLVKERCVIIDDLGKEPEKVYGQADRSFFRLCNEAEHRGILLIITTNLSTTPVSDPRYPDSIERRYGPEVLDRLRAITSVAIFRGDSLRN